MKLNWRDATFGSVLKDESGQEETTAEQIDAQSMEESTEVSAHMHVTSERRHAYRRSRKKATTRPCCALNWTARRWSSVFVSLTAGCFGSPSSICAQCTGPSRKHSKGCVYCSVQLGGAHILPSPSEGLARAPRNMLKFDTQRSNEDHARSTSRYRVAVVSQVANTLST